MITDYTHDHFMPPFKTLIWKITGSKTIQYSGFFCPVCGEWEDHKYKAPILATDRDLYLICEKCSGVKDE